MFLVAANTRQAIVGQKEWITTGSSGIQVQFLFSEDWDGLSKFAVFRNAEIEESVIPIALPESNLTELPAENCAAEYVDEKVYVGVYGSDGLGHIIIPTIWVSLGVLKEGAAYEGMDPPQPTPDMWTQILAIAQNAGAENAEAAEKAEAGAKEAASTAQAAAAEVKNLSVDADTLAAGEPATVEKTVDAGTGAVKLKFGIPQGPKGDPLTYEDLTEEQEAELVQGPILEAQNAAVTAVGNARVNAVNAVGSAGTTAVGAVNQAGTTQVGNVNQAGTTQVQAVADKGAEVIGSIPPDYSDLADEVDDLTRHLSDITVDGYNLIKIAEHGVGAYYASGSTLVFQPSYDNYHYAIMPVEPNSRYYVSANPRWWVLTDDNNNVLSSGAGFNPYTKRYIDTGDATKFYYTIDNGTWNNETVYGPRYAIIVAKSNSGSGARDNVSKPEWLSGISQRMCDSKYAFAFNRARLKFTKNANKKFYFKNLLALDSDYAVVTVDAVSMESTTKDYISVTYTNAGEKAIVGYVYDANLSLVEQQSDIKVNVANDNLSNCSALVIGDSTVEQNVMTQKMLDAFTTRNKTLTLFGTRGTAPNLHEGRSGWSAKQYCTQSTDNPFYNNGFDFSHYMTAQGYSAVDFVVLQIGINDLYNVGLTDLDDKIAETMGYVCSMIDSILAWNTSQKIIVNLLTPVNPNYTGDYMYIKRNIFVRYNAQMLLEITKYNTANVRPSDTFAILDPESDISDNVHPTAIGYEKMANEVVSQINCWQNGA